MAAFLYIAGNTRLRAKVHFVADMNMSGYTDLAAEHTPFAYLGGTGDTHLGCHHRMRTDFVVMGHLYQVIQLYTAVHDGGSHCCAVYASIGADFHVVFQYGDTDLRNLLITLGSRGETESVRTDYATGVQYTVVSYAAIVVDGYICVNDTVTAYLGAASDGGVRMNHRIVSHFCVLSDTGKRCNVNIFAYFCGFGNVCPRIDTGTLWFALFVKV